MIRLRPHYPVEVVTMEPTRTDPVRHLVDRFFPDLQTVLREEPVRPDAKESKSEVFQNKSVLAAVESAWDASDLKARFTKSVERLELH